MKGPLVLVDEWMKTFWTILNVKPKSLYDYQRMYIRHLQPVIGHRDLSDNLKVELQRKILEMPPQSARHALMVAKSIWREAILFGLCENNPTVGVRSPRVQVKERAFFTWEEVDARDWGRYNNQVRFLALHGLRWSEAVVLTESDIHDGFVWIEKSVYGSCKSKSSRRKVPYLGYFEPLPKTYKALRSAVNKHGITVHSLRKSYAYLLKTQGLHVTTAQRLLGHSDPIMTLKVYTAVRDDEIDVAADVLKASLRQPKTV
jgi:integrase